VQGAQGAELDNQLVLSIGLTWRRVAAHDQRSSWPRVAAFGVAAAQLAAALPHHLSEVT
jgi:hypothetical protein